MGGISPAGSDRIFAMGPRPTMADSEPESDRWQTMSVSERQVAYSPSSCIEGDYQPYIEQYERRSAQARLLCSGWRSLAYGDAPSQTMDFFPPVGSEGNLAPALVFFHGGYWQELSKRESAFAASAWVDQGVGYAAVDYTLAPAATVDEIVVECRNAVLWLHDHASELGLDPKRIVAVGSSAGAHLAAMVALHHWQPSHLDHNLLRGVVLLSGVYDLRPLVGTSIAEPLRLDTAKAIELSPSSADLNHFPPSLLAWGQAETDEFKHQSRDFAQQLRSAGNTTDAFEVAARNHFDVVFEIGDVTTRTSSGIVSLLG